MNKILTVKRICSVRLTEDDIRTAVLSHYNLPSTAEITNDDEGEPCVTWVVMDEMNVEIGERKT